MRFGAETLSMVVLADLTQCELLSHISSCTAPDVEQLRLFAAANGLV